MVDIEDTTDRSTPELPTGENELSRRYLRMMARWIPVGVEYFAEWPERPNCGRAKKMMKFCFTCRLNTEVTAVQ